MLTTSEAAATQLQPNEHHECLQRAERIARHVFPGATVETRHPHQPRPTGNGAVELWLRVSVTPGEGEA